MSAYEFTRAPFGACPTQAEGRTADGRPFYFRARHSRWSLTVGPVGALIETTYDVFGPGLHTHWGYDPSGGWMTYEEVVEVLDRELRDCCPLWDRPGEAR